MTNAEKPAVRSARHTPSNKTQSQWLLPSSFGLLGRERYGHRIIGTTNWRSEKKSFGVKQADRRQHVYVIGRTGMGKTTLLENMILQDIEQDRGVAVLDPHGDLAQRLLDCVARRRFNDVVYFNSQDLQWPFALSPFEHVDPEKRHLVAASLMSVFEKPFASSWGPRMAHILRNSSLALLEAAARGSSLSPACCVMHITERRSSRSSRIRRSATSGRAGSRPTGLAFVPKRLPPS